MIKRQLVNGGIILHHWCIVKKCVISATEANVDYLCKVAGGSYEFRPLDLDSPDLAMFDEATAGRHAEYIKEHMARTASHPEDICIANLYTGEMRYA